MQHDVAGDDRFFWILTGVLVAAAAGAAIFETVVPRASYQDYTLLVSPAVLVVSALAVLPTVIAAWRHKRNALAIGALNLLLGWTIVGWVIALIWALMHETPRAPAEA